MTKRQFDQATQENWGGKYMASDERLAYKAKRQKQGQWDREGRLARRAQECTPYKWHGIRRFSARVGLPLFVD